MEKNVVIGGAFNVRIGELGGAEWLRYGERCSKDKTVGNGGRNLVGWFINKGWSVLNGRTTGDCDGEYTYVEARGNTVIDYVIVSEDIKDRILEFRVEERVESDYLPLCVKMKREERRRQDLGQEKEEKEKKIEIIVWNEEAIKKYREATKELGTSREGENESVEQKWKVIKKIVHGAMVKKKIRRLRELGHKDWWGKSYTRKKREVKKTYKKWRRGKIAKIRYIKVRKSFRKFVERKAKEKREQEKKKLKRIKREIEIWRFINKKRGKKERIDNNIGKEEWRNYFIRLLEGEEEKGEEEIKEEVKGIEERRQEEENLRKEEIWKAVGKLKRKKAAGIDGIPAEAWKYAGEGLRTKVTEIIKLI